MEKNKPKKMLLFGPGFGHNVENKLRALQNTSLFEVDFIALNLDKTFVDKYPYINFIPSKIKLSRRHPLRTFKSIRWLYNQIRSSVKYDIVFSLGVEDFLGALFVLFAPKNAKIALEIWSIHMVERAKKNKTFCQKYDKYIIDKADIVCQNWWGFQELFVNTFPEYEHKFLMYPLSYPDIFFSDEKHIPQSDFVKDFLGNIPDEQIVCFWPRSFIPSNGHKLLIESLGVVKHNNAELLRNFKLYLWGGNVKNEETYKSILETIENINLSDNIEIVDHPYVPLKDIFAIEERSDFFVQIAHDDVLSTFIMEILCSGKPYILSNLRTFQFLNEKYDLNVELVDNDVNVIATKIEAILTRIHTSTAIVDKSMRDKCKRCFSVSSVKPFVEVLYEAV